MKLHSKMILFLMTVFSFINSTSASEDITILFDPWLQVLESPLKNANSGPKAVANLLAISQSRIAAFNLQALGRSFSAVNPEFDEIRDSFKTIEDGLGAIDKWKSQGNKKKEAASISQFAKKLREEKWYGSNGKMAQLRDRIQKLTSAVEGSEKLILQRLFQSLLVIANTNFDFSGLETATGLHEYRRKIRWFMIESRMLGGLLSFKEDEQSCPSEPVVDLLRTEFTVNSPIDEVFSEIRSSKYSQLPSAKEEALTCQISACLFYALSDTVEKIGKIKDDVEEALGDSGSDVTPEKYKRRAEVVYERVKQTDVFRLLSSEIQPCL